MPNHVTNELVISASEEVVNNIYQECGTKCESVHEKAYDGTLIYTKRSTNEVGYLDENTGVFKIRKKQKLVIGAIDGFEPSMSEERYVFPDFNKIIPQPDNLYKENLTSEKEIELDIKGIPNWYTWNVKNWNTKWNSYEHLELEHGSYRFLTAWSNVIVVIIALSKKYPKASFHYRWCDEDISYNLGECFIENGEIIKENIPIEGSKEAYELCFEMDEIRDDYKLVNGNYEFIEED